MCILGLFFFFFFDVMSWKYQLKSVLLYHRISVALLIFCLKDLSFDVGEVWKSSTITVFLSVSPFLSVSSCFMYLNAPFGWTYVNKYTLLFFNWSFYLYIMSFFIHLYGLCFSLFCLVWILLPLLSCHFHLPEIFFFHPLTFNLYVSFAHFGYVVGSIL